MSPGNLPSTRHSDAQNPDHIICLTEVERREKYIKMLELTSKSHPILMELLIHCLQNIPDARPSSGLLLKNLIPIKEQIYREHEKDAEDLPNLTSMLQIEESTPMDQEDATITKV